MFLSLYQIYRTYALDSTICFTILSGTLYVLFGPRRELRWLKMWVYLVLSALSFSLAFQGVLLVVLKGEALIFTDPRHFLYFFVCQVALSLLWSCALLQGDVFPKLLHILVLVAFMQLYRGVCAPLYLQEQTMEPSLYACLDLLTASGLYVCLVALAWLFVRCRIEVSLLLDARTRLIMLYILVSILAATLLPELVSYANSAYVVSAIILTDFPLIYYIFGRFTQNLEEQRRMDAALGKAKAEWMVYEESLELRTRIRQERHELKNQYFHLLVLLREGRFEEATSELEDRVDLVSRELKTVDTGSAYLDYLLAAKERAAREAHIAFVLTADVAERVTFDEQAAGTVLSNLIDNAIEASVGQEDPCVEVGISYVRGYLKGTVTNNVAGDVLATNPDLRTTKKDAGMHGYGLKIVRRTLDEHDGLFDIAVSDGRFRATFMLPTDA